MPRSFDELTSNGCESPVYGKANLFFFSTLHYFTAVYCVLHVHCARRCGRMVVAGTSGLRCIAVAPHDWTYDTGALIERALEGTLCSDDTVEYF